ncbi:MAG: HlyD family type I secretion periplasmic adaptor subunit, partial [Hyphomicrobium sp.]
MTLEPPTNPRHSIRHHQWLGLIVVAILVGGVGSWAATTDIEGAVIASGVLVVDTHVKKVQHPSGGIVAQIHVRNGDQVQAGDTVLHLDDTITRSNLAIVTKGLTELTARKARLEAERDGADAIVVPDELALRSSDEDVAHVITGEQRLFDLRTAARVGQKAQLRQRIKQLNNEIEGLTAQANAKSREVELIQTELKGARELFEKNLMPISKMTNLEREATRVAGERAKLSSTIAQVKARIAETELAIIQIDHDLASQVARELRDIDAKIGEYVERKVAAEDQLKRIDIRAPQTGIVHQLSVHTVGGVINAGETLMLIVPKADNLTVEAKATPADIDQLSLGQAARLRFSALNQRTTPEIFGTLSRISADITTDANTGANYYTVRVALSADEVSRLGDTALVPGMPVEVFVKTGERKVLSYLVKPL